MKFEAFGKLRMRNVCKVGLLFSNDAVWKSVASALGDGFLRVPGDEFAVYWTANPFPTPLVTEWAGGPPARAPLRLGVRAGHSAAAALRSGRI